MFVSVNSMIDANKVVDVGLAVQCRSVNIAAISNATVISFVLYDEVELTSLEGVVSANTSNIRRVRRNYG